jgi:hypothetical protein
MTVRLAFLHIGQPHFTPAAEAWLEGLGQMKNPMTSMRSKCGTFHATECPLMVGTIKLLSSEMWSDIVWYLFSDVSDEHAASLFRAEGSLKWQWTSSRPQQSLWLVNISLWTSHDNMMVGRGLRNSSQPKYYLH